MRKIYQNREKNVIKKKEYNNRKINIKIDIKINIVKK